MIQEGKFVFLGTGASSGIPVMGCHCGVCKSANPKNRRLRTSGLICLGKKAYLIDTSPDIRQQSLASDIRSVDGIIITHSHYDHVGGLEEMRVFNFRQQKAIDCLCSDESFADIQKMFFYLFEPHEPGNSYTSQFHFTKVTDSEGKCDLNGLPVSYFRYMQSKASVLGIRIGDLAYLTDLKSYSEGIFSFLEGVSTLVVSALSFTPSPFHLTIDEAVDFSKKVGAKNSYFVHMNHTIEHDGVNSLLPKGVSLAYDGLQIPFQVN